MINRQPSISFPNQFLSHIYWDLIQHTPIGYGGYRYSLHAIEAVTSFQWTICCVTRAEFPYQLDSWKGKVEAMSNGYRVQVFIFDNAKEFVSGDVKDYCNRKQIHIRTGAPYIPAHQGKIERAG